MALKHLLALFAFLWALTSSQAIASADSNDQRKIALTTGFFSYSGKSSNGAVTLSNIGAYHFNFLQQLYSKLAMGIGYTVIMSDGLGGDMSFGIDLGLNYFPFTGITNANYRTDQKSIRIAPLWKPYVGLSFHQRQYQSISTSYAGFGLIGGADYHWKDNISWSADVRLISLLGPKDATATEMTLNIGIVFDL